VLIAHDLAVIRHMSDRVAVMYLGEIVEQGETDALYDTPLHPYTQALMRAIPIPSPRSRKVDAGLKGDVPSPLAPPPAAAFTPVARWRATSVRPNVRSFWKWVRGRFVACHHWEDARAGVPAAADAPAHSPGGRAALRALSGTQSRRDGGRRGARVMTVQFIHRLPFRAGQDARRAERQFTGHGVAGGLRRRTRPSCRSRTRPLAGGAFTRSGMVTEFISPEER
jgi:oligopeptide/dipeptide ABC transporter ATP-binding protein